MKRFLIILSLLMAVLTLTAAADDLITSPAPGNLLISPAPDEDRKALIESLHKGIIPITPDMTYDEFMSYMEVVDNSDNKILTAKFDTFLRVIEAYFYGNMTATEIFSRFTTKVDSVDINNMDEAYSTLFSMMDRFSYYLKPGEAESFFNPTASKGIGIKMIWRDAKDDAPAGIYVDEVADGSTAATAGIMIGDRIVEFNGVDMRGLGFEALAVYSTSVPADAETLTVTLERDGAEKEYTLTRGQNVFDEYTLTLHPEKELIYLDINSFMYENTAIHIGGELDIAVSQGYKNVIIDLQGNSGGDVYVAATLLSKFTPDVEVLFSMGRDGITDSVVFSSLGNGHKFDRISILVDSATASSAEIFADTLRNIAGAKIIGRQTFGKGVAQSVITFEDRSAVGITSYVAYDRNGNTYNEVGLIPDHRVVLKAERNKLSDKAPAFTVFDYVKAVEGAENDAVLGLEVRLETIGFLAPDKADGKWDSSTTEAVKAFRLYVGQESAGYLDADTYHKLMDAIEAYENTYYYTFSAYDYAYSFIPTASHR